MRAIGLGFAARCEAMAMPRRLAAFYIWAAPLVRALPWTTSNLASQHSSEHTDEGRSPDQGRSPNVRAGCTARHSRRLTSGGIAVMQQACSKKQEIIRLLRNAAKAATKTFKPHLFYAICNHSHCVSPT